MPKARDNHYVPQWYQRGFLLGHSNLLHYLDLNPDTKRLPDGRVITMNQRSMRSTSQCFFQSDLYTTFFGEYINDEIERRLFGKIDDTGARAVRAFIGKDVAGWHHHFTDFFSYIDSQKIRTPKGLHWIKHHYPNLGQVDLMTEMQALRNLHCTIWSEGVHEIVSANNSAVKFLLTDHPVTVYNRAYPPESEQCVYPNCLVPQSSGVCYSELQEVNLWAIYTMLTPRRRHESEKKYKTLRRRSLGSPNACR